MPAFCNSCIYFHMEKTAIAIIDKSDYLEKMQNILSDSSKFNPVSVAEYKQ